MSTEATLTWIDGSDVAQQLPGLPGSVGHSVRWCNHDQLWQRQAWAMLRGTQIWYKTEQIATFNAIGAWRGGLCAAAVGQRTRRSALAAFRKDTNHWEMKIWQPMTH